MAARIGWADESISSFRVTRSASSRKIAACSVLRTQAPAASATMALLESAVASDAASCDHQPQPTTCVDASVVGHC